METSESLFRNLCQHAQQNTIPQLKQELRGLGLTVTGNKKELCARLAAYYCSQRTYAQSDYCSPNYEYAEDIYVPVVTNIQEIPEHILAKELLPRLSETGLAPFAQTARFGQRMVSDRLDQCFAPLTSKEIVALVADNNYITLVLYNAENDPVANFLVYSDEKGGYEMEGSGKQHFKWTGSTADVVFDIYALYRLAVLRNCVDMFPAMVRKNWGPVVDSPLLRKDSTQRVVNMQKLLYPLTKVDPAKYSSISEGIEQATTKKQLQQIVNNAIKAFQ